MIALKLHNHSVGSVDGDCFLLTNAPDLESPTDHWYWVRETGYFANTIDHRIIHPTRNLFTGEITLTLYASERDRPHTDPITDHSL